LDLISSLCNKECYFHETGKIEVIETHISWILLTGEFAYKIKKPVNLGFLDFSTLSKRKFYCEEEVRLNQRWAPEIYLDVKAIRGSVEHPMLGGDGSLLEYAVQMKQFPSDQTFDMILSQNRFEQDMLDSMAKKITDLHKSAPVVTGSRSGDFAQSLYTSAADNFKVIDITSDNNSSLLRDVLHWTQNEFHKKEKFFQSREANGFYRECHGDLHLGNMAWVKDQILLFDGIEFNDAFRFIDVMSEVAFVVMDFMEHKREDLAFRFLNLYLEYTGDYEGLGGLYFYLTYRAMVRAKVSYIRSQQSHLSELDKKKEELQFQEYLSLAQRFTQNELPRIILTCGYSGSGKTSLARTLYGNRIIHLRSDVERKRLFDRATNSHDATDYEAGIYNRTASENTYARLRALTKILVQDGFSVIVDASFLETERRDSFRFLAQELSCDFMILHCVADENTLRERIEMRRAQNIDASDATTEILAHQISKGYQFTELEKPHLQTINTKE
jgi:aminoglycoside phosphotransferase family enzyme/predicted kinase